VTDEPTVNEVSELFRLEPWTTSWAARHDQGLTHLRAWLAAGRPVVDRSAVDVAGEPAIVACVRDVIAIVPAPAVWRLVTGRVQIRCGRDFCDRIPAGVDGFVDVTRDPLYVGILKADEETVAHELAHVWTSEQNPFHKGLDAEQSARLLACSRTDVDEQDVAKVVDSIMVDELAADRLASFWLGRSVDTTSGRLGELRRRRIRAEFGQSVP
jgi:hypothetical protein